MAYNFHMDECEFVIYLSPVTRQNRYRHYCAWEGKEILEFRIQYEALMGNEWVAVVRYASAHGQPHRDVLHPNNKPETKDWLSDYVDIDVLTIGQREIIKNWPIHRQRFEQELKNG